MCVVNILLNNAKQTWVDDTTEMMIEERDSIYLTNMK